MKLRLLMIFIAVVVISIWFGPNKMLGHSDEGLPFYDANRTANNYSSFFYDTGLGLSGAFNIPRLPLFLLVAQLQKVGMSPGDSQKLIYFFLIVIPLITTPLLVEELFEPQSKNIGFIASIFYLFNLYTYSQVWTRFVMSLTFLWSYLPLFLLLWIKLTKTHDRKYLIFLVITSFFYSSTFVIISPLLTCWICAMVYLVIHLLKNNKKINNLLFTFFVVSVWLISNLWWMYPIWQLRSSSYGSSIDPSANYLSLSQVSKYFPNIQVLTLRQSFMLGPQRPNYEFYAQKKVWYISLLILAVALIGILTSHSSVGKIYFLTLFALGWFISKGTNPPLGEQFFSLLFSKFSLSQVFRNSYEKFGTVLVLAYSIFFGIGLSSISKKLGRWSIMVVLLLTCGYLMYPLWTSETLNKLAGVEVPKYYADANLYIRQKNRPLERIFQLPFLRGQVLSYAWNYTGEEPTEFLFDNASVTKTLTNKTLDEFFLKLGEPKYFRNNPNFVNLLGVMNIGHIVLHDDVIISSLHQENASDTRQYVNKWNNISNGVKFGNLEVYELSPQVVPGRIYPADKLIPADDLDDAFEKITSDTFNPQTDAILISSQNNNLNDIPSTFSIPSYKIITSERAHHKFEAQNVQNPFILILANNFDEFWNAKINNQLLTKHILVNGYANGWIVEKKGSYLIDISYKVLPWN